MTERELLERIAELQKSELRRSHKNHRPRDQFRRVMRSQKEDALLRIVTLPGYAPHRGYINGGFDGKTLLHSGKYIMYPKNSRDQKRLKRATSKRARRCKGNFHRKLHEYWWAIY